MRNLVVLIVSVLLFACASPSGVAQWQGKPLNQVVAQYGVPHGFHKMDDGSRFAEYYYDTKTQQLDPVNGQCTITLLVNKQGIIEATHKSKDCEQQIAAH
ncbi:hypothetical protein [Thalassotalea agarivorans]|uniref:SmpA / OmlA family protein n=1 Tax=Thalassotalea agarivorans TaxID=349064 RepID=A0A1H9YMR8_THASX|nr:hypothetical protein [Thalassotalea agarivorans]SES69797.1 hypothetical protein SAMN05660429_00265 [Thalassotalea agarivorans]